MSNKCMNYVWQRSKSKGRARLVLLALADAANDDGDCYPGKSSLSMKCNMEQRNLEQVLAQLQAEGEIRIFHRRAGTIDHTNRYHLIMAGGRSPDRPIP